MQLELKLPFYELIEWTIFRLNTPHSQSESFLIYLDFNHSLFNSNEFLILKLDELRARVTELEDELAEKAASHEADCENLR